MTVKPRGYDGKALAEFYTANPQFGALYNDVNATQYGVKNGAVVDPGRYYFLYRTLLGYVRSRIRSRAVVADIGCGMGIMAGMCRDVYEKYAGMDISLERVQQARRLLPSAKCFWVVGDAQRLPFKQGSFDQVVSLEVIEHVPDPAAYLNEINRALVRGGSLILSTPGSFFYNDNRARIYRDQHLYQFNPGTLKRLLRKCSFAVCSSHGVGFRVQLFIPVWLGSDVIKFLYACLTRSKLKSGYGRAISLEWDIVTQPWVSKLYFAFKDKRVWFFLMRIFGAAGGFLPGLSSTMVVECRK
ncbi:MAG: class I SAM-dependent methyltransferase [Candidatus Omnitrophota bacterium]